MHGGQATVFVICRIGAVALGSSTSCRRRRFNFFVFVLPFMEEELKPEISIKENQK